MGKLCIGNFGAKLENADSECGDLPVIYGAVLFTPSPPEPLPLFG